MPDFRLFAEGARSLVITRHLAAQPDLVQRAHLDPLLVPRWMGGGDHPMTECRIDPRPGGRFRQVWTGPDGGTFAVEGTFLAIAPGRIEHVELFDPDWTGGETRVVTTFAAVPGGTALRMEVVYSSPEARDGAAASGMAAGMEAAYDRLDPIL
ncbi:MAG: SRPBCC domain-containing protein [Paracoccaceae bacterium]|nr:MAG: SRPBCC domain-containing protein [Paracoccaceae bacterium]